VFLSVSETSSDLHVQSGVHTMHVIKGVGCQIPARVRSVSEGRWGDVCTRDEG